MTIQLWRASQEAEFAREARDQLHEIEAQEREDADHRVSEGEPATTWDEGSAAA